MSFVQLHFSKSKVSLLFKHLRGSVWLSGRSRGVLGFRPNPTFPANSSYSYISVADLWGSILILTL